VCVQYCNKYLFEVADRAGDECFGRFLAGKVSFEDTLRSSIADGSDPFASAPETSRSLEPTRTNGNNVNLDEETLAGSETNLTYGLAVQAMTAKFQQLRIAIGGQP